jgi:hypothetical protein
MEVLILIIVLIVALYLGLHKPVQDAADMATSATETLKHKQSLANQKFYLSNKVSKANAIQAEINKRSFVSYSEMDDSELEAELAKLTKKS